MSAHFITFAMHFYCCEEVTSKQHAHDKKEKKTKACTTQRSEHISFCGSRPQKRASA